MVGKEQLARQSVARVAALKLQLPEVVLVNRDVAASQIGAETCPPNNSESEYTAPCPSAAFYLS